MLFLRSRAHSPIDWSHGHPFTMETSPVAVIVPMYDDDPDHVPDTVNVKLAAPASPCVPLALNLAIVAGPLSVREESIAACFRMGLGLVLVESSQSPLKSLS